MTGNVLIKNRTLSSDVPYLFGLPKQKQRFCAIQAFCAAKPWRRANSLRPSILISCRNPKNRRFCAVQAFCAAKPWRRANSLRPSILISHRNPKKEVTTYVVTSFLGAGDEARSQHCRAATRTAGDKRPTGAFSRFARALFDPLPAGTKNKGMTYVMPLFFGAGDEARTRYLHLGKVALYQMSYARGTRYTIPDIFCFVKHRF